MEYFTENNCIIFAIIVSRKLFKFKPGIVYLQLEMMIDTTKRHRYMIHLKLHGRFRIHAAVHRFDLQWT